MIGKIVLIALGLFLVLGAAACKGKVAYISHDGNISLITANGTDQIALTSDAGDLIYADPSWSWDGRYLAWIKVAKAERRQPIVKDAAIAVFDTATKETKEFDFPDRKSAILSFAWRRDRDSIYAGYSTEEVSYDCPQETIKGFRVVELNIETGSVISHHDLEDGTIPRYILTSPNPNLLGVYVEHYCGTLRELCVLDLSSGEKRCTGYGTIGLPKWSPDGSKLVSDDCARPCINSTVNFIDPLTLDESVFLPESNGIIYGQPQWSPDGNLIIYHKAYARGVFESEDLGIWATTVDGTNTWKITDGYLLPDLQAFSPDGQYVIYENGKSELWITTLDGGFKYKLADGQYPSWQPKEPSPTPTP